MYLLGLPGGDDSHHKIIILVQSLIGKIEKEGKFGLFINVGHLGPMLMRETVVEGLEESADLVFVGLCPSVAEPPKCLGPPTHVIVPRTSDGDAGDPPTLEVR